MLTPPLNVLVVYLLLCIVASISQPNTHLVVHPWTLFTHKHYWMFIPYFGEKPEFHFWQKFQNGSHFPGNRLWHVMNRPKCMC